MIVSEFRTEIMTSISRFVRPVTLLALITCVTTASPQDKPSSSAPARTIGARLKANGIPNFGQVTPNLYRGAQPNAAGIAELKKRGVDIVVDLRGGGSKSEESQATKLGIRYISIPSHCPFPKDEPFAKFLRVIQENPGKKVFVHCRLGDDRTGMAVAAYRMAMEGWSAADAMNEMKAFGFSTAHRVICPRLADYEQDFPRRLKTSQAFKEFAGQRQ